MKINKKLIEEKINNEIKDTNEIVGYCIATTMNLPYPGWLNPLGLMVLAILSATVSNLFLILLVAFIIFIIKTAIKVYEKHILVFLQGNIKLLQVKGDNLDVVNTHTYSYRNVISVETEVKRNLHITFTNDKPKTFVSTIKSINSSFALKDFDVKKFCDEKKIEN